MKNIIKQGLAFLSLYLLSLVFFSSRVMAATYGSDAYGAGLYGIGASPTPSPAPTSGPTTGPTSGPTTGNGSSSGSDPAPPVCNDSPPGVVVPWLYAAVPQNGNEVMLYFTDAGDPVDRYVLEFGTKSGTYLYGSTNIGGKGTRKYLVRSLIPDTTYYFRIRGGNGCAVGGWSNEISTHTQVFVSFNQLQTTDIGVDPGESTGLIPDMSSDLPQEEEFLEETGQFGGYSLTIDVTDENKNILKGAVVTIDSGLQKQTTDSSGLVHFENVKPGNHTILVTYEVYSGQQSINLMGDAKDLEFHLTVVRKNVVVAPLDAMIMAIVIIFVIIFVGILFFLRRRSKKATVFEDSLSKITPTKPIRIEVN